LRLRVLDEVEPLLEFRQARGVHVHAILIAREFGLQLAQGGHGLVVGGGERGGGWIHPLQFLEQPPDGAGLLEQTRLVLAELVQRGLAELQQPRGIAGALVLGGETLLLVRGGAGFGDFADLKAQQVELLRVGPLVHDQRGLFRLQVSPAADHAGKGVAGGLEAAEGVENGELAGRVEERLVVVRAVDVPPTTRRG
jgi:hypothetical protein